VGLVTFGIAFVPFISKQLPVHNVDVCSENYSFCKFIFLFSIFEVKILVVNKFM